MDDRFIESGATKYTSPVAGELEKNLKDGAGKLFYLRVCNTTAALIYVFVCDGLTNAAGPMMPPIPVPANGQTELTLPGALAFAVGLTLAASTSQVAYAAAGANAMQVCVVSK